MSTWYRILAWPRRFAFANRAQICADSAASSSASPSLSSSPCPSPSTSGPGTDSSRVGRTSSSGSSSSSPACAGAPASTALPSDDRAGPRLFPSLAPAPPAQPFSALSCARLHRGRYARRSAVPSIRRGLPRPAPDLIAVLGPLRSPGTQADIPSPFTNSLRTAVTEFA